MNDLTNWISVDVDLPDYEVPVFLQNDKGNVNVGMRTHTNVTGERYILLLHTSLEVHTKYEGAKTIYWAELNIPKPAIIT
jgi:hypothetical protein